MPHSLAELSESIFGTLGLLGANNHLALKEDQSDRACLLLIDGFGRNSYVEYSNLIPTLREFQYHETLSATFPSTTATSLTSLGTGLNAGIHGMVGYTMRIPHSGPPERTLNALKWDERVDPHIWQPNQTLFERAANQGMRVSQVSNKRYADTGFTRASLRGAEYLGVSSLDEMATSASRALATPGSFAYLYLNDVDEASHAAGYGSERFKNSLQKVEELINQLLRELPKRTRLYVTSDHGMINRGDYEVIGKENNLDLDIDLLAGEPRVRYLHMAESKLESVRERWIDHLGDRVQIFTRSEAIAAGLFGSEVTEKIKERIGDLVVVAKGSLILVEPAREAQQLAMVGHHGGMTPDETEIPLLVATI